MFSMMFRSRCIYLSYQYNASNPGLYFHKGIWQVWYLVVIIINQYISGLSLSTFKIKRGFQDLKKCLGYLTKLLLGNNMPCRIDFPLGDKNIFDQIFCKGFIFSYGGAWNSINLVKWFTSHDFNKKLNFIFLKTFSQIYQINKQALIVPSICFTKILIFSYRIISSVKSCSCMHAFTFSYIWVFENKTHDLFEIRRYN